MNLKLLLVIFVDMYAYDSFSVINAGYPRAGIWADEHW